MGSIFIDGKTYTGNNIVISGDTVVIDGKVQEEGINGIVRIDVTGNIESLYSEASVTLTGDVNGDVESGGSVKCRNVGGNVCAGGSVRCDDVMGKVTAGGSVSR